MALKFYLQPNAITPDPNDHSAKVQLAGTHYMDDIIELALKRGTTLTRTDLKAASNLFFEVMSDEVANGYSLITPLFNIRPGIKGVFTNASDTFDPTRHAKKASVSAGDLVSKKLQEAKVEKVASSAPSPTLLEYTDVNSDTTNSLVTPGGIGMIVGEELKFDPDNPLEGLFFVPTDGSAETKVGIMAKRTEGQLFFAIPDTLATGSYILEVRKGYGINANLRSGVLDDALNVV